MAFWNDRGRLSAVHISKHSSCRLKVTVGCLRSTYPSIHFSPGEGAPKIAVGGPTCTNPSIRLSHRRRHSEDHGRWIAVHISKHSPSGRRKTLWRSQSVARRAREHVRRNHLAWTSFEAIGLPTSPENQKKNTFFPQKQGSLGRAQRTKTTERDTCV